MKSIWKKPIVAMICLAIPLGILAGIVAVLGSSPNPPAWTRHAMLAIVVVGGLAFPSVWYAVTFRKR